MVDPLTALVIIVAVPVFIIIAGYVYGQITGFDEVESVQEAVAKAHDVREGNDD